MLTGHCHADNVAFGHSFGEGVCHEEYDTGTNDKGSRALDKSEHLYHQASVLYSAVQRRGPTHTESRARRYRPAHHQIHSHRLFPIPLALFKVFFQTLLQSNLEIIVPSPSIFRRDEINVPAVLAGEVCHIEGTGFEAWQDVC